MTASPEKNLAQQMASRSPRIRSFWRSVEPGQKFGFFDFDQTILRAGADIEDMAFNQFGLIQSVEAWKKDTAEIERLKGMEGVLVEGRALSLSHYPRTVTSELSEHTGLPIGTSMSPEVIYRLGKQIGLYTLDSFKFRTHALAALTWCERLDIRRIVVSASPVDLVQGVCDSYKEEIGLELDTVLGTEDIYHQNGSVEEALLLYGAPKTEIVKGVKERGGIAVIGVGDKPATSDAFIHECKIKGHINNSLPDQGRDEWTRVASRLVERELGGYNLEI